MASALRDVWRELPGRCCARDGRSNMEFQPQIISGRGTGLPRFLTQESAGVAEARRARASFGLLRFLDSLHRRASCIYGLCPERRAESNAEGSCCLTGSCFKKRHDFLVLNELTCVCLAETFFDCEDVFRARLEELLYGGVDDFIRGRLMILGRLTDLRPKFFRDLDGDGYQSHEARIDRWGVWSKWFLLGWVRLERISR